MNNRELDALVAVHVMGERVGYMLRVAVDKGTAWMNGQWREQPFDGVGFDSLEPDRGRRHYRKTATHQQVGILDTTGNGKPVKRYSSDIADAWLVVEKLAAGGFCVRISNKVFRDMWWAYIYDNATEHYAMPVATTQADSAPEAICIAALRAMGVDYNTPVPDSAVSTDSGTRGEG